MVFEINPYDKCVANKLIDSTQCAIAWYVDYNKLRHKNPEVISDIINDAKKVFGELSIVRGNKNTFLVISIDIKDITTQVDMVKQMEECINIFW